MNIGYYVRQPPVSVSSVSSGLKLQNASVQIYAILGEGGGDY